MGSEELSHFFRFFSFFFAFLFFFRFSSLFFVFLRFSSFFFVFRLFFWNKGKRLQFTGKMGNFTPTPSAPTPFGTSRSSQTITCNCNCGRILKIPVDLKTTRSCNSKCSIRFILRSPENCSCNPLNKSKVVISCVY